MQNYKTEFIRFALSLNVLRFGEFTLKSGRVSPYFFNAGLFNTGADLARLGEFYATALQAQKLDYDVILALHIKVFLSVLRFLLRYLIVSESISRCVLIVKKPKITVKVVI